MNNHMMGIWIDHNLAKLVEVKDGRQIASTTIESNAEPRHRSTGQTGVPLPGHIGGNTESHDRNRRTEELHRFFDHVMDRIPETAEVMIMGPGEARLELADRINRKSRLGARIISSESASRMTINEIFGRICEHAGGNAIST